MYKKGFSLLEIIFTLFILGALTLPIIKLFQINTNLIHHNYLIREASDLASSYLAVESYSDTPFIELTNSNKIFSVSKNITAIESGHAKQVAITVRWQDQINAFSSLTLTRDYYEIVDQ